MANPANTRISRYGEFTYFRVNIVSPFVAHVEINRPEKINAFNDDMFSQMPHLFNTLSHDPEIRVILFSGTGERGFSAGLDVTDASSSGPVGKPSDDHDFARKAWAVRRHALRYQESVNAIERCEKPVICLLHGIAYGAAVDFAVACDIRHCTRDAKICVREIDAGLAPDVGTLSRLPKIGVPHSWSKEVIYSARVFQGVEAGSVGLVSRVAESKEAMIRDALALAAEIALKSPVAVQSSKALWNFSVDRPVADGLLYTAAWNGAMVLSDDVKAAMMSGLTRKQPQFAKL